jgi:hypothetical protein
MEISDRKPRLEQSQAAHHQVSREGQDTFRGVEEAEAPHSHATTNFQKALDAVVPSCLVLK